MKKINLIFGCHAHQPVGNFDFVFEQAYDQCYLPFINVLQQFPLVKTVLHLTGPLFDWFDARHPEFLDQLAKLVQSGQIEIMGGGYYEPLVCAIPERDAIAQIQRMQKYCTDRFGKTPRGMWLTERVWEPQMARILHKAGVEYTALDDAHFLCSGLRPDQCYGYHMTEDEGLVLKVFPILEKLRYLVPFHQVHETIDYLHELASEDGMRCAVLHDDYEKFGVWPGTHGSVYTEGWLARFFQALTDNQEWLNTVTYSEYLDMAPPVGRAYLPCASYEEMMIWALPTPMQRELNEVRRELQQQDGLYHRTAPFLRGGFWRNFLSKYSESNNIQKRMLRVSHRLDKLRVQASTPSHHLVDAERLLHQGQCNCAYWHGVFGGLYLNHLRTALYERLIAADNALNLAEERAPEYLTLDITDIDGDGNDEAIFENSRLAAFFSPVDGGTIFELDIKDEPFNLCNTLTRRDEPYHDLLRAGAAQVGTESQGDLSIHEMVKAKEANLDAHLVYDPWRRVSLRDRFLDSGAYPDSLWRNDAMEYGDFATGRYTLEEGKESLTLRRQGRIQYAGESIMATLEKQILLAPDESALEIRYDITREGDWPVDLWFGVEFAVNLLTGSAPDRYYWSEDCNLGRAMLGVRESNDGLRHLAVRDDWQRLESSWRFNLPARVHRFALETVSQSEGGQERVHQGCVVLPCWRLAETAENGRFSLIIRWETSLV